MENSLLKDLAIEIGEHLNYEAIFGRNLKRHENLFETIVSVPDIAAPIKLASDDKNQNIIEILWEKFELGKNPEILRIVSKHIYLLN